MNKIKVTAKQRENAHEALRMWATVPPENVYPELSYWRMDRSNAPPECGTVACFGGWCAWWPEFARQGVKVGAFGWPTITRREGYGTAGYLFGAEQLFYPRASGCAADRVFAGTDHELVTHRLNWLIANSEVIE